MRTTEFRVRILYLNSKDKCFELPKSGARMAGLFISGILILLMVLPLSCGKRKTQVKTPIPASTPSTPSTTSPVSTPAAPLPDLPPPAAGIPVSPSIRIGLTIEAKEVRISSSGNYYLLEKLPEASRQLIQGSVQVRVEQEGGSASSIYHIQVASLTRREAAEDLRQKLAEAFKVPATVQENAAAGTHRVRVGGFSTRKEAQDYSKILISAGYPDAFLVEEAGSRAGGTATLALRGSDNLFRLSQTGFLFLPSSSTSFLYVDGKPYRGFFDISLNQRNRITVVNQLGTEEYLLGVVPAEIGPTYHSEFEALAAQSIAARTYALKHMGMYRAEGFDLSADARTQVYNGASWEKDATNEAVLRTSGLAIYYQDELINAMYMSTCGGRTEDFSNVFDAPPVLYLKSVFCAAESDGETLIEGKHELEQVILADDGSIANRNLELARVLGMVESGSDISVENLAGPVERGEAIRWIENARKLAKKERSVESPGGAQLSTRAGFLGYAAESFFGADEIERRISVRDVEYYLGNLSDGSSVPEPARHALAYLIQCGLWRPFPDNTARPNEPIRKIDAIFLLLSWIESAQPEILRKGTFGGAGALEAARSPESSISVKWGNRTQEFHLSPKLSLFRLDAGRKLPANSLRIIGNEKLNFHVGQGGTIDFLEVELNQTGASSDRYSSLATWNVTSTRSAIAEKIRTLSGDIGEFQDLKPARLGNSGRAVQIEVIGSRRSVVINGYRVKSALELKDTLFTIAREHNPDGSIARFTFHGRGYGHGIGLCQVGAFGMARAGRSYEEILKTYYSGVQIRKAY